MEQSDSGISVIVSTYERPRHLWLNLLGLSRQTVPPGEILVADDGSGEEVCAVIERFAAESNVRVLHVWQPHEENRVARSRNNAIRAAACGYLVFLDQDCIPGSDFLSVHASSRRRGVFKIGSRVFLDETEAAHLEEEDILSGRFEQFLDETEMKKLRKAQRKNRFYAFWRKYFWPIKAKPKLTGCNFSIHKGDLLKINGFDENYVGWGQEDDDLGRRLYLAGMTSESVVNSAITFHLWHPLQGGPNVSWRDGRNVEYYLRKDVSIYAENGLKKSDDAEPADVRVRVYP